MKQLLILLTFIAPILLSALLNAQVFHPYVGFGVGTFAQSQHFKASSFNICLDYRYTYTNKHFGIDFITSFDFFPNFKYLEENVEMLMSNIGAEFFLLSRENYGFLIGGTIEYPATIEDGFNKFQKKRLVPSFNIGISEKQFTLLLSLKHFDYTNSYKINELHEHFDAIETVRINAIRLICKYRITGNKSKKEAKE